MSSGRGESRATTDSREDRHPMHEAVSELFARALELGAADREQLLADVRRERPALADQVARLLANAGDEPSLSPIDRSPWRELSEAGAGEIATPERIGPYRILRELGRGGMARVFLAEEETDIFRRTLALKVLDRSLYDDDAIRRFRDEVRILSSLEHPGIARFLDGGRTEDGFWFLALEHVDGFDLISWARDRALPTRERIALFLEAIEAVSYAHTRGVIHRDLKPAHLLIDSHGHPRLLDFGISKLVDPETGERLSTRTESRALTPAYASPEQFRGEAATPASDVYSLGAILYELLAGKRPFAETQTSPAQFERAVLESDPDPPSSVARRTGSTDGSPEALPEVPLPRGALSRDLDAICLKALRKAPENRYADASALAEDLRACLDGRPVAARRGGRRYRLARFARRHRQGVALAGALLVATVAVALLLLRGFGSPSEPAPRPFPFSEIGTFEIEDLRREFAALPASVDAGAMLALRLLREQNFDEMRLVIGRLRQIPDEERHPLIDYVEGQLAIQLEEPQRALVHLTRARDEAIAQGRGELLGQFRASRGRLLATLGRRDEGGAEMELALRNFEEAGDHASQSRVLNDLAIEQLQRGEFAKGEELLARSIAEARAADNFPGTMLFNLASLEIIRGRPDLAEERLAELVEARRKANNPRQLSEALGQLARAIADQGRASESRPLLDEAMALLPERAGSAHRKHYLHILGEIELDAGRLDAVGPIVAELREAAQEAGDAFGLALALDLEARVDGARGRFDEMRRGFAESRRLTREGGDLDHTAECGAAEALAELRAGHFTEAERAAIAATEVLAPGAKESGAIVLADLVRVRALAGAGKAAEAKSHLATLSDSSASPALERRVAFLVTRAAVARSERQLAAARSDLESAVAVATANGYVVDALDARIDLAQLLREQGETARADATALTAATQARVLGLDALASRAGAALPNR